MTGNQQHRQFRVLGVKFGQQLKAVHAGHADVADHHAGPVALDARGNAGGLRQRQDVKASEVQGLIQRLAQMRVIVDQDDLYV
jgi:hypothetical protein